jgi:hypothetical protein
MIQWANHIFSGIVQSLMLKVQIKLYCVTIRRQFQFHYTGKYINQFILVGPYFLQTELRDQALKRLNETNIPLSNPV